MRTQCSAAIRLSNHDWTWCGLLACEALLDVRHAASVCETILRHQNSYISSLRAFTVVRDPLERLVSELGGHDVGGWKHFPWCCVRACVFDFDS